MDELATNVRKLVIDALKLISSKEEQLSYQKEVPQINVSEELFNHWEDTYIPDSPVNERAFTKEELIALKEFNLTFDRVCDGTPRNLPLIDEFMKTKEWKELTESAALALNKMIKV